MISVSLARVRNWMARLSAYLHPIREAHRKLVAQVGIEPTQPVPYESTVRPVDL